MTEPKRRRIIRDHRIVEDEWIEVADDAPLPAGDVIVSATRWRAGVSVSGRLGVRFPSTENPADEALAGVDLVAIEFPRFADGRGYSYAKLLRQQRGFTGELRAVGDVLRDQLRYLWRCGFNSFELREDKDLEDALKAFSEFTVDYPQQGVVNRA